MSVLLTVVHPLRQGAASVVEVRADSSRLEHGVASLTGSYSMAVRPFEEHPHGLHRKWNPKLVFKGNRIIYILCQETPTLPP